MRDQVPEAGTLDVAWMVGKGSRTDNWELRISMRSFHRNYLGPGRAWIIGHAPEWIDRRRVRCIRWPDPYTACKDANLIQKALRLAMEPELSDPFVLCSDDHILLRRTAKQDFRLWHCGVIPEQVDADATRWQIRLCETGLRLRKQGFSAWNYEGHIPYPMRKTWVREALRFDFGADPGMCIFSTILNCSGTAGRELGSEPVRAWLGEPQLSEAAIDEALCGHRFACLDDRSLRNQGLVQRLTDMFSVAAPWELQA